MRYSWSGRTLQRSVAWVHSTDGGGAMTDSRNTFPPALQPVRCSRVAFHVIRSGTGRSSRSCASTGCTTSSPSSASVITTRSTWTSVHRPTDTSTTTRRATASTWPARSKSSGRVSSNSASYSARGRIYSPATFGLSPGCRTRFVPSRLSASGKLSRPSCKRLSTSSSRRSTIRRWRPPRWPRFTGLPCATAPRL